MLNSNLKSTLKKWKLNEFELEISPKTLKSLFLSRFFDRYLVKISLILNIFKSAFQTWIQHKIFKKMVYNAKFFKVLFWPYSDFSEIKSSIRNRVDDFEFFIDFFKWKRSNPKCVVGFCPILFILTLQ